MCLGVGLGGHGEGRRRRPSLACGGLDRAVEVMYTPRRPSPVASPVDLGRAGRHRDLSVCRPPCPGSQGLQLSQHVRSHCVTRYVRLSPTLLTRQHDHLAGLDPSLRVDATYRATRLAQALAPWLDRVQLRLRDHVSRLVFSALLWDCSAAPWSRVCSSDAPSSHRILLHHHRPFARCVFACPRMRCLI